MAWLAGVDGCQGGWIVAIASTEGADAPLIRVVPRFADLFAGEIVLDFIAVDMPIGLSDRVQGSGRGPEQAVRALLGDRQSSVFSIPARRAVEATDYWEACALALSASDPPRKVSKQGFHLFPKIREIDGLLRSEPGLRARVFETHPELAFRTDPGERAAHGIADSEPSFFLPMIDPDSRELLSDDYAFCRRARDADFRIWLAPWVRTTHSGPAIFQGSLPDLAQLFSVHSASSTE